VSAYGPNRVTILKRATFILLAPCLGLVWFCVLITLLATGVGLAVTLLGFPVLVAAVYVVRPCAQLERRLIRDLLGADIPGRYRRAAKEGWWPAVQARLGDAQTYKDLAYLIVQLPVGLVWLALLLTDLVLVLPALLLTPLTRAPARFVLGGIDLIAKAHLGWARMVLSSTPDPELAEVRSQQARMVEAALAERRRLERDLHDGAQQRLVALSLKLGMARRRLNGDEATAQLVAEAHEDAKLAIAELRDLARGIHPAVLTERGLAAALEDLAARCPVPAEVEAAPADRLAPAVEATAYFVTAEGLANVAKYANAERAWVSARLVGGELIVEVRDDGAGGADPARGSGLRGLADRVGALAGRLELESAPGAGTRLRATLPAEVIPEDDSGSSAGTTRARV
jgi:signal transduction histidine kinase